MTARLWWGDGTRDLMGNGNNSCFIVHYHSLRPKFFLSVTSLAAFLRILLRRQNGKGGVTVRSRLGRLLRQFLGDFNKETFDIVGILGRSLQMQQSVLGSVRAGFLEFYLTTIFQVCLVSGQGDDNVRVSPALKFLHPTLGTRERVRIGNIVHYNGRRGTSVVHGSQTAITFLSSRVPTEKGACVRVANTRLAGLEGGFSFLPDFKFYRSIVQLYSLCQKGR